MNIHQHLLNCVAKSFYGIDVHFVDLAATNDGACDDIVSQFDREIQDLMIRGLRPRALIWSSPVYSTGLMLPPAEMALLARKHDLVSICDGAHLLGMIDFNFNALDIDFLICSGSKWQSASKGSGLIFIKSSRVGGDVLGNLTVASPGQWPAERDSSLEARLSLSSASRADSFDALVRACEMWREFGRANMSKYILARCEGLRNSIENQWGTESVVFGRTKLARASGILAFHPRLNGKRLDTKISLEEFTVCLKREYGFVTKPVKVNSSLQARGDWAVRICTPPWITAQDLDNLMSALKAVARA